MMFVSEFLELYDISRLGSLKCIYKSRNLKPRKCFECSQEFASCEYEVHGDTTETFLNDLKDWNLELRCPIHIAMTSEEHATKGTILNDDEDKLKMLHILVESVRRHFSDIVDHIPDWIADLQLRKSEDKTEEVL